MTGWSTNIPFIKQDLVEAGTDVDLMGVSAFLFVERMPLSVVPFVEVDSASAMMVAAESIPSAPLSSSIIMMLSCNVNRR